MKKLTYLLFLAIGVVGCSVESMDSTENLLTANASSKLLAASTSEMVFLEKVCAGEETLVTVNFPQRTNPQGRNLPSNIQVQLEIYGVWVEIYQANLNDVTTTSFNYTFADAMDYTLQYAAGPGGFYAPQTLTVEDCNSCENLLVAELTCGTTKTASFTFTAEEAGAIVIQGGLTSGTTINSAESNVLNKIEDHPSVINSKANVTRWEGNIEACQEVTVTITFTGGNGIGDWSAKRGEDVLGETAAESCTEE